MDLFQPDYTLPDRLAPLLRVGTCSWKYDTWKGLVYESGMKYHADDYLVDYGRYFNTVEVDQWFWSLYPPEPVLPEARHTTTYAASVPPDFRFSVKAPNSITLTHYYAKQPAQYRQWANVENEHFLSVDLLKRFLDTLEPLHSRLGPVMFQFEYLSRKKMPSLDAFLEKLDVFFDAAPAGFQYAVEPRNRDYLAPAYFDFLGERSIAHVFLDGYRMPPIGDVWREFEPRTAGVSILRLHGPDRAGIEEMTGKNWSRIVLPKPEGIAAAVEIAEANARHRVTTYVNVNNHYEGSAPLTIERFLQVLRQARHSE